MTYMAKVRLGRGAVAFYDPQSKVYVTMKKPIDTVPFGVKVDGLKRGVASKKIEVIEGSLEPIAMMAVEEEAPVTPVVEVKKAKAKAVETVVEEVVTEIKEEPVVAEVAVEAVVEEVVTEEVVEEEKPEHKKAGRKKATPKVEEEVEKTEE